MSVWSGCELKADFLAVVGLAGLSYGGRRTPILPTGARAIASADLYLAENGAGFDGDAPLFFGDTSLPSESEKRYPANNTTAEVLYGCTTKNIAYCENNNEKKPDDFLGVDKPLHSPKTEKAKNGVPLSQHASKTRPTVRGAPVFFLKVQVWSSETFP